MCGIAGYVWSDSRHSFAAATTVQTMVSSLARRGPDAEGIAAWDGAVLGHRRLSIFDLSQAGRQPMLSEDRQVAVVFNGAIYNFRALRADLESRGVRFRSQTDTEVLLHGYRAWGMDGLLARIRGMFAIGLWDDANRTLFLVRDRLGVKPLVYVVGDGCLAFASSMRALRNAGLVEQLDPQAVAEYLEFGYVTDERGIYRGAQKIAAATILEWRDGELGTRCYWQPPPARTSHAIAFEDAVAETERLLLQAVDRRLFADVPVGSLLSGGVDSSLVCWAISHLGGDVTAFTVGTPGDPWDETSDAGETARRLGIRHEILPLSPDKSSSVEDLVSAYGEPFACASALGMISISAVVRSSATVLLTGDGGDDVFLGYPEHLHFWRAQKLACALPAFTSELWNTFRGMLPGVGLLRRARHFLDYSTGGLGAVACAHPGLPGYRRHRLLGARLAEARLPQREISWSIESARSLLPQFLEYDRRGRFAGEYMTKVDGATMHHALEARSPFLDQDLWEFAASLPFDVRFRGGRLKAVLRELARRKIGRRVAEGRKRGFGIPVQRWIAGKWRASVEEAFRHSILDREGWISAEAVRRMLASVASNSPAPHQLWYVFVLESWLQFERAARQHALASAPPGAGPFEWSRNHQ